MVDSATRPANRPPVLRANPAIQEQGGDASQGSPPRPGDQITPEEEIRDPLVLEFLNLKDEYSEHDLEAAFIGKLEDFLLELGGDFAFIGRQKRLRIGNEWYRIDLLSSTATCTPGRHRPEDWQVHDATRQMTYLNYAQEHWTHKGENPPVGLILCPRRTLLSPITHSKDCPTRSWRPSTDSLCPTNGFSSRSWTGPSEPSNCEI